MFIKIKYSDKKCKILKNYAFKIYLKQFHIIVIFQF